MALPQKKIEILYTEEEYLAFERESDVRHEYLDGHIYEMAGESDEHGDITTNLTMLIATQLRGTPCRARVKDTKVRSGPAPNNKDKRKSKGLFSYPDLVVICGEPQHLDKYRDVILNPTVIIEVLSPSTAFFDMRGKFLRYQHWSPTLTDYILVWQEGPLVERYLRREDGGWIFYSYQGLESAFTIESINCTLNLADIYDRVEFPPEDEDEIDDVESQNTN